ncbi:hypothetical protein ACSBR2_003008 [Camellia fascicularis]
MSASMLKEHRMIQQHFSQHMREDITMACLSKTQIQWHLNQIHRLQLQRTNHDWFGRRMQYQLKNLSDEEHRKEFKSI